MKSDLLDGLNSYQRVRRERRDAEFIRSKIPVMVASAASTARDLNTWAGTDVVFRREDFREYRKGEKVDAVICARLDLDHPLYFPDNLRGRCADCECDLQHRPEIGPGPKLCICCCARRVLED